MSLVTLDGKPVMAGNLPSDGGGFRDRGPADRLVEDINARRKIVA